MWLDHEMDGAVSSVTTNLSNDELTDAELTFKGRLAIWSAILSVLFLPQIAYNIGDFPVSTNFVCYALIALYLLMSGHASFSIPVFILYSLTAATACLAMVLTTSPVSWASLLLLVVLYAPFCFRLQNQHDLTLIQGYIQRSYVSAATVIAAIAVVQIVLVNGFGATFLTNVNFVLPEAIRGAGTYTYFRESGGIVKANGFFLRESSSLSIVTGLALIIEYFTRARPRTLAILALGLFSSFSGSGVFPLILGFLMPRSLRRVPHFLVSSLVFIFALFALYSWEIPGLTLFFDRLSEFQTPGTSAHARFLAPMDMVQRSLDEGGASLWLGHGGGSYLRSTGLLGVKYEISDPTWARLIYEYGLVGFTLISALFAIRIWSSGLRPEIRIFILSSWIIAGLLSPSSTLSFWLLTLVPQARRPHVPEHLNFTTTANPSGISSKLLI
jgi:hypothetical protein